MTGNQRKQLVSVVYPKAFECPVTIGLDSRRRQLQIRRDALMSPPFEHAFTYISLTPSKRAQQQIISAGLSAERQVPIDRGEERAPKFPDGVDLVVGKDPLLFIAIEIDRRQPASVMSGNDRYPLTEPVPRVDRLAVTRRKFRRVPVQKDGVRLAQMLLGRTERFIPSIQRRPVYTPRVLGAVRHAETTGDVQSRRLVVEETIDRPPAKGHPAVELRQRLASKRRISDRSDDTHERFLRPAFVGAATGSH